MSSDSPQALSWNGENGEKWVANQERLDRMLAAFGDAAIAAAAPRPGEAVLDIGCGAGATSVALAERVGPGGSVLGVDISAQLIARAQEIGGAPEFRLADAATEAFAPGSFDLLFSRFGVMFFDDPVAAFTHMHAALKPGGRLAFVCWRTTEENDWTTVPMNAIRDIVPPAPPTDPDAPGPVSFADPARVTRILDQAGYSDVRIGAFDDEILFGIGETRDAAIDDAVDHAFQVGPLGRALAGQPNAVVTRAAAAVRTAFAENAGPDSVTIHGAAWIVTAAI